MENGQQREANNNGPSSGVDADDLCRKPLHVLAATIAEKGLCAGLESRKNGGFFLDGCKLFLTIRYQEAVKLEWPITLLVASDRLTVAAEVGWASQNFHVAHPAQSLAPIQPEAIVLDCGAPGFRFFPLSLEASCPAIYIKEGVPLVIRSSDMTRQGNGRSINVPLHRSLDIKRLSHPELPYRTCRRIALTTTASQASDASLTTYQRPPLIFIRGDDSVAKIPLASKQKLAFHSGIALAWTATVSFHYKRVICCQRRVAAVEGPGVIWVASPRISRAYVRPMTQ